MESNESEQLYKASILGTLSVKSQKRCAGKCWDESGTCQHGEAFDEAVCGQRDHKDLPAIRHD